MIGAFDARRYSPEDVFIIEVPGALPFSYFLIWCSLQGSDNLRPRGFTTSAASSLAMLSVDVALLPSVSSHRYLV